MFRHSFISMLDAYEAVFPDETAVVERVRRLVTTHADCFERTCRPGHITGSAWILSPDRRRILLTHHKKLDRWLQLGGHADGEPDPIDVALREAKEESGLDRLQVLPIQGRLLPIDIDVHEIPARYNAAGRLVEDAHDHHDIRYLLMATVEASPQPSDESHDVRWFTSTELLSVTSERSIHRMLMKSQPWMGD